MADTIAVGQELEGQILAAVRKSQEAALGAIQVFTDAIQPVTSAIPAVTPPLAYHFTQQLLAGQRKFAADVLQLTAPLIPPPVELGSSAQK